MLARYIRESGCFETSAESAVIVLGEVRTGYDIGERAEGAFDLRDGARVFGDEVAVHIEVRVEGGKTGAESGHSWWARGPEMGRFGGDEHGQSSGPRLPR